MCIAATRPDPEPLTYARSSGARRPPGDNPDADGTPRSRAPHDVRSTTSWPRPGALRPGTLVTYSPKVFIPLTTLCRDVCGYCTFARPPRRGERAYLSEDEVLAIARAGAEAGCTEALFTLGDRPEARYASRARSSRRSAARRRSSTSPAARAACSRRRGSCRTSTRASCPATSSPRCGPSPPRWGSCSRRPRAARRPRRAALGLTGQGSRRGGSRRCGSPASSGSPSRAASSSGSARRARSGSTRCSSSGALAHEHGHLREVIVQNFRAKPDTRMAEHPDASLEEHLWSVAVARIVLGPDVHVQAPPNLAYDDFPAAARRGDRRLGRRLARHRRPRQPRGAVARGRAAPRRVREPRARAGPAPAALPGARRRPRPVGRPGRRPGDPARRRRARPRARGPLGSRRAGHGALRRRARPRAARARRRGARRGGARAALRGRGEPSASGSSRRPTRCGARSAGTR